MSKDINLTFPSNAANEWEVKSELIAFIHNNNKKL